MAKKVVSEKTVNVAPIEKSIARLLIELKTTSKRIEKLIIDFHPGDIKVNKKLTTNQSVEDFERKARSDDASINALIDYNDLIKSLIVKSNASTPVIVAGEKMTVAEAIEKKSSIVKKKNLLERYRTALHSLKRQFETLQTKADRELETFITATYGSKDLSKVNKDDLERISVAFRETHEPVIFDPLGIDDKARALELWISNFESEVDISLSESNSRTMITIPSQSNIFI
jgi:hypothetical protein